MYRTKELIKQAIFRKVVRAAKKIKIEPKVTLAEWAKGKTFASNVPKKFMNITVPKKATPGAVQDYLRRLGK